LAAYTNVSFISEREIKCFHDKQNLKEFLTTKPGLKKIFKGILHTEEEDKCNHGNLGKNKLTRRPEKQMRIRKESSITKQQKDMNYYISHNNSDC
jgi:hypothetical protein